MTLSLCILYPLTLHIPSIIYNTVSGQYDAPQLEMEVQNKSIITYNLLVRLAFHIHNLPSNKAGNAAHCRVFILHLLVVWLTGSCGSLLLPSLGGV